MTRVLADNPKTWKTTQDRPISLEVILLKQTYVLPWNQFLYAEGCNDEVRVAFALTHDVLVKGSSLHSLLSDLAVQRIAQLHEPARADRFEEAGEAFIREISVKKIDAGRL